MLEPIPVGRSEKYVLINSKDIVEGLQYNGFRLASVHAGSPKTGKEVIRMRHQDPFVFNGETLFPEIIIHNSYNGRHRFTFQMGVFRVICSNGLTITVVDLGNFDAIHRGEAAKTVEQLVQAKTTATPKLVEVLGQMQHRVLSDQERIEYALKAAEFRWKRNFSPEDTKVLLEAARWEDKKPDLWHTFNVVQENLIQARVKPEGVKRLKPITLGQRIEEVNEFLFEQAYSLI